MSTACKDCRYYYDTRGMVGKCSLCTIAHINFESSQKMEGGNKMSKFKIGNRVKTKSTEGTGTVTATFSDRLNREIGICDVEFEDYSYTNMDEDLELAVGIAKILKEANHG